ncbi:MAG: TonB family protein [Bacteroidetes bacterium]|nr:TonB family protein [Bacteroidota bacterium]
MEMKTDKLKGLIGTLVFHGIILLILFLLSFTTKLPLPGEEGVEVNLGYSDEGTGEIQPYKPAEQESSPQYSNPATDQEKEEEIVTQDTEETSIVEKKKEKEKKPEVPAKKEPVKEEPKVNPDALYKGKSKTTSEGGSEGITGKEGDQGNPNGTSDSDNYQGQGGSGDGLSYSLTGRSPKYLPKPSRTFDENGTVVVQIDVDKYGKVVKAIAIDKGSNTTNSTLRSLAEQAARQAIFNANPNAAEVQRGTITYHFVVKN